MANVLYIANSNLVLLVGLQNYLTKAYINDATVEVTLKDADDADVVGAAWPLAMDYVAGSDGEYVVSLPHDLTLAEKASYTATITATKDTSVGDWTLPVSAQVRKP